ncbi:ATPase family AAA domain-containing protein 1 [Diaporthe helianthi]|uniref:ATPase family AAA domain-containing protein 1 n=1 Tax=Diaporthe helianthi TaxID=158607 RepID=A0A2P5HI00_DIAHE|nr:ATPase family AAA domain-containing protein 1 [Diaporthe helianthi]
MAQKTHEGLPNSSSSRYRLPGWFLERNVKTVLDLIGTSAQFPVCQCETCVKSKDSYDDDEEDDEEEQLSTISKLNTDSAKASVDQGSKNKSSVDTPDPHTTAEKHETRQEDAISYSKFSELRDAVATNMLWRRIRPRDGTVPFKRCSMAPVAECNTCIMEPMIMNDIATQVAKSLSMGLISLNYEDLERLGNEFHNQDKEQWACKSEEQAAEKKSDQDSKQIPPTIGTGASDSKASEDSTARKDAKNETEEESKETSLESKVESKEKGNNESKEESRETPMEEKNEETKGDTKEEAKEGGTAETAASTAPSKQPIKDDWRPDWSDGATFTEHYFAARGKKWQDDETVSYSAWRERAKQSYAAILDGVTTKTSRTSKPKDDPTVKEDTTPAQRGLLVHVIDCDYSNKVFDYRKNRRVLVRLGELVRERRGNGEDIVLMVSTRNLDVGYKRCRKLCVSDLSTVTLSIVNPSKKNSENRALRRKGEVNSGRLSRILAALMADGDKDGPKVEWLKTATGDDLARYGQDVWAVDDVHRAAGQILTRAWIKSHSAVTSKHVDAALRKLRLLKSGRNSNEEEKSGDNDTEEAEKDPLEGLFLDEYEGKFRDCVVKPKDLKVSWDDIILDQDTKEVIQNLVPSSKIDVEASSEFLLSQLRMKGCLLYGPPGTGKTHLCRAIAASSGSRMLSIDYAATQSMWVGETEKYIRGAFSLAAKLSPCVLLIDEADALFYRRGSNDASWERGATTQFLTEMEGLSANPDAPLVVVATNRPWDMDEAFLRRLPQKFYIGLPDQDARAAILRIFLKADDLDPAVDIEGIAAATQNFSGSDLRSLCAEAALIWKTEQSRIDTLCSGVSPAFATARQMPKRLRLDVDHFSAAFEKMQPSNSREQSEELERFHRRYNPVQSELGQGNGGKRYVYNKESRRNEACSVREVITRVVPPVEDCTPANMQLVVWRDPGSIICPLRGAHRGASDTPSIRICEKFKALIEATFGVQLRADHGSMTTKPKSEGVRTMRDEIGTETIPGELPNENNTIKSEGNVKTRVQTGETDSPSSVTSSSVTACEVGNSDATIEVRASDQKDDEVSVASFSTASSEVKPSGVTPELGGNGQPERNNSDKEVEVVKPQIVKGVPCSEFETEKAQSTSGHQEIGLDVALPSSPGRTKEGRTTAESEGPDQSEAELAVLEPQEQKTGADVDLLPLLVTLASVFWYVGTEGYVDDPCAH